MDKKLSQLSFCKWEKSDIIKNIEDMHRLVADPRFVCEKCARVSQHRVNVCKPHAFKQANGSEAS